jgi:hypothetical protein
LKDLVGALPVGMDCHSGDDPHWSATNGATYKEIWVEPVNRFLGALSIYLSETELSAGKQKFKKNIQIQTEATTAGSDSAKVKVKITGEGNHSLNFIGFNIQSELDGKQVSLTKGKTVELNLEVQVTDPNMPYIIVLKDDDDPDLRWEVVGSFVEFSL